MHRNDGKEFHYLQHQETGVFGIISREFPGEESDSVLSMVPKIEETEEEIVSRRLLEEVLYIWMKDHEVLALILVHLLKLGCA